ncbi:vomeronasal type-1 receptor 90-like [Sciurus carolinensis]|uniref:vomeronasal type-1 receptor 90-like n=1 Tax=Sciurus carolinensis TaxID=30640 RepID=UPI001FB435A5|nr:vomeronasal type-1 receptor 90-like [Sciurus carolinensis]
MRKNKKLNCIIHIRNTFYSQLGIGILANTILFLFHLIKLLFDNRIKNTDLIIGLLSLIHLLMLLIMGFIATDIFTSQQGLWDDITCKSVFYLYRLMRGLSISTTCLLSVLQAITLSPRNSCLAKFKPKSPHHTLRSLLFLWVFYMSFSAHFSISTADKSNPFIFHTGIFWDVFLLGLMALSIGYMVIILITLCRHKRQCQHLHSSSLPPKASPEQRATRTILLLMNFFMLMYCLDCICFSFRTMQKNGPFNTIPQRKAAHLCDIKSEPTFSCVENKAVECEGWFLSQLSLITEDSWMNWITEGS